MPRISTNDLLRELEQRLARDPDISTRALARQLRAEGVRVANDRLRALARAVRSGQTTLQDIIISERTGFVSERQRRIAVSEFSTDIERRTVPRPTHIAISYRAMARVMVTFYGQHLETRTIAVTGRIVQPVEQATGQFVAERVARQIVGQVTQQVGTGTESYVEGIDVTILSQDISISSTELRGDRNRRR